jgi:hypothetical protein
MRDEIALTMIMIHLACSNSRTYRYLSSVPSRTAMFRILAVAPLSANLLLTYALALPLVSS